MRVSLCGWVLAERFFFAFEGAVATLNSRLADPYQLPEYSRGHFQTKQREHIALLF